MRSDSSDSYIDSSPANIRMNVLSRNPENAPYGDETEYKDD